VARKVLIAEDEPLTAELLALLLTFEGFDVVRASNGREALEAARAERPDILLLDVIMPSLHGDVVTRRLRSDPAFDGCPVVLISSVDESEVRWREAGADVFLQKPINLRTLPALVRSLLSGRKKAAPIR
jgi:DNA-binding response OmpR family regulator